MIKHNLWPVCDERIGEVHSVQNMFNACKPSNKPLISTIETTTVNVLGN